MHIPLFLGARLTDAGTLQVYEAEADAGAAGGKRVVVVTEDNKWQLVGLIQGKFHLYRLVSDSEIGLESGDWSSVAGAPEEFVLPPDLAARVAKSAASVRAGYRVVRISYRKTVLMQQDILVPVAQCPSVFVMGDPAKTLAGRVLGGNQLRPVFEEGLMPPHVLEEMDACDVRSLEVLDTQKEPDAQLQVQPGDPRVLPEDERLGGRH